MARGKIGFVSGFAQGFDPGAFGRAYGRAHERSTRHQDRLEARTYEHGEYNRRRGVERAEAQETWRRKQGYTEGTPEHARRIEEEKKDKASKRLSRFYAKAGLGPKANLFVNENVAKIRATEEDSPDFMSLSSKMEKAMTRDLYLANQRQQKVYLATQKEKPLTPAQKQSIIAKGATAGAQFQAIVAKLNDVDEPEELTPHTLGNLQRLSFATAYSDALNKDKNAPQPAYPPLAHVAMDARFNSAQLLKLLTGARMIRQMDLQGLHYWPNSDKGLINQLEIVLDLERRSNEGPGRFTIGRPTLPPVPPGK